MKKDIATECYCVVASDDKDKCLPRKTLKETRLKPTDVNLTFLLGEREVGNALAHGHEGEVVLHHRLVELALQAAKCPEPEQERVDSDLKRCYLTCPKQIEPPWSCTQPHRP